jgi:glycosyltransferase involved in cell wall biosynthesis
VRVCYVSSHAHGFDGWGRHTVEVVSGARQRGVEPVLVTAGGEIDPVLSDIEHHALLPPLFARRFETPRSLQYAPRLREVLRTCDIVHCIVELYAPLVALARPRGVSYVQTAHGTWAVRPLENFAQRIFFAPALRQVDLLLPVSNYTRDRMAALLRLPRTEVLSGGVHVNQFARESTAELPDWAREHPVVLGVGGVKPRKGFDVGLGAVVQARKQIPDLHYVVIGSLESAGYVTELHLRAASLGMVDNFHLLGRESFEHLVAWYQEAEVFMLVPVSIGSSFEGLGLVYLEAGAAHTPSIGTRDSGAGEAIDEDVTGLLVPPGDVAAAAEALVRLLSDDDLRERMGEAAHERARHMSWDALSNRLVELYEDLLGERRSV